MSTAVREREFWAIIKAVFADALSRGVLSANGEAIRGKYSTILKGNTPANVTVTFIPPRLAGDLLPEAYFRWTLWPDETGRRPQGYFNVAYRSGWGWILYGDYEYRRVVARATDLTSLVEGVEA